MFEAFRERLRSPSRLTKPGGSPLRRILAILIALAFVPFALADDDCDPSTSGTSLRVLVVPVGPFYVVNDVCQMECAFSTWFYEESNGLPGLQRGDEVVDDTCGGLIESDTIIS